MGQMNFDKKSGWKKFFTGKGFYLALAVCLVAVCGVAVATFMEALPQSNSGNSQDSPTTVVPAPTTAQAVDKPVTNVPDDRTTTVSTTTSTTVAPTDVPTDTKPADLFVFPLSNEVLVPFSQEPVFSQTMQDWRAHNGTDFKGEIGQDVKAAADGTITKVEKDALWGEIIEIDHGLNIISRYCGVTAKGLTVGQKVKVGEVIGMLSQVPSEIVEEPHLHLEILAEGKYVDPVETIGLEVK